MRELMTKGRKLKAHLVRETAGQYSSKRGRRIGGVLVHGFYAVIADLDMSTASAGR